VVSIREPLENHVSVGSHRDLGEWNRPWQLLQQLRCPLHGQGIDRRRAVAVPIRFRVAAEVPFFFKQWGGRTPKAGGRELEGERWDEMSERAFGS